MKQKLVFSSKDNLSRLSLHSVDYNVTKMSTPIIKEQLICSFSWSIIVVNNLNARQPSPHPPSVEFN